MKPKALMTVFLLTVILLPHQASALKKTGFIKLKERSHEGYVTTVYRGNSLDYRSFLLVEFADSLMEHRTRVRIEAELIRKNGARFEIPVPLYSQVTDSGFMAYTYRDYYPDSDAPLEETLIRLAEWAAEPGDQLHLKIYDDVSYSYLFERYIQIRKHGLWGNLSFPFLSVQRSGDHPGSLGAGISYTMRYVQPERSLSNQLGFGMNLSLLDFNASQKVEVGLGFVVSFPDDLLCVGAGKNLTVNRNSGYYFLGVNLPAVKEKLGL